MKLSRTVLIMMATVVAALSYAADTTIPTQQAGDPTIITPISFVFNATPYAEATNGTMKELEVNDAAPETALTANAYTREGYTFYGWALTPDGDAIYGDGATVNFKNVAVDAKEGKVFLYARWAKTNYTVKFDKNGGKGKMKAQKQDFGKPSKLTKSAFTKKGYVFVGWALEKKGAVVYKDAVAPAIPTDGEVTLYARYAKKNYKVKFYANGGKGKAYTQKMVYGKKAKLVANKFKAPAGLEFKGWAKTKADAAASNVTYRDMKPVKNVLKAGTTAKLYAVWGA